MTREELQSDLDTSKRQSAGMDSSKLENKKRAEYDEVQKNFTVIESKINPLDTDYANLVSRLDSVLK
jgi:hypothetical protein